MKDKPIQIDTEEWYYKGCFIQEQIHPKLMRYHVFADTLLQEDIGVCSTFTEAKTLCRANEVKEPYLGLKSFGYG